MSAVLKNSSTHDYHVADISLADFGNKEMRIAETEMPGLMAIRAEFAAKQPIFVLHAKTAVVDRKTLFVGTYNLDPRSQNLNTEAGIVMDSPKLAAEAAAAIGSIHQQRIGSCWARLFSFHREFSMATV